MEFCWFARFDFLRENKFQKKLKTSRRRLKANEQRWTMANRETCEKARTVWEKPPEGLAKCHATFCHISRFPVFQLQKLPATEGCSNGKANQDQCPCHQLIYNYAHRHGRPEVGQQKPFWRICSISQLRHETETETETQKCQRFRLVCLLGNTLRKYSKQKLKQ